MKKNKPVIEAAALECQFLQRSNIRTPAEVLKRYIQKQRILEMCKQ